MMDSTTYQQIKQNVNIPLEDFCDSDRRLLAMIPMEWLTVYEEYFNQFILNPMNIDTAESKRIEKDLSRTFSLFSKDPAYTSIFHSDRMIEKRPQPQFRILGYSFISPFRSDPPVVLQSVNNKKMIHIEHLKIVLTAVCKDSGYCQGMNFLAAKLLLIENDPKFAFIVLSYILRQKHLLILFDPHNSCLMDYMNIFHKRLRRHNRLVYRHLKLINFPPLCFTIEWFTTCFIVSSPGKLSTLVLDLIVAGFDDIMMDIGLALLDTIQEKVLSLNLDGMQNGFKVLLNAVDPIPVMDRAMLIRERSMREMRYTLDGVNILKMMYELFLANATQTDPVRQQYLRDQHPYRRLRCHTRPTQLKLSSVATENEDVSPEEDGCSGDDEQSACFPLQPSGRLQQHFPHTAALTTTTTTTTIPASDPAAIAIAAAAALGMSPSRRRRRRTARRRQRSAKRTALTMCSQRYLSKVDYRRYLDVHFGECDFAIEFLDAHIQQRSRRGMHSSKNAAARDSSPALSSDSVTLPSWRESDTNYFIDCKSVEEGVDGEGVDLTLISFPFSPANNQQVDHYITTTSPLSDPRTFPPDQPEYIIYAPGSSGKKPKPLRGNVCSRVCSMHWNDAMLSITEDWFLPYLETK